MEYFQRIGLLREYTLWGSTLFEGVDTQSIYSLKVLTLSKSLLLKIV